MKKRGLAVILIITMISTVFSGCGSSKSEAAQSTQSADTSGKKNITISNTADLSTLDNTVAVTGEDMTVIQNVVEGLYRTTTTGVEPAGATSVAVSDDKLTYTFTLRDEKWSDKTPVTAYDYEYSWKRLANPSVGAEYAYMLVSAGIKNANDVCFKNADINTLGVKATDDKTLVVTLDHAVPYLDSLLTGTYFAPIEKAFAEKQGSQFGLSKDNVVYNGPYTVFDWQVGGDTVVLQKNPNYWDASNVKADKLTFKTIKDAQSGVLAYESKELDYVTISGDLVAKYKNSKEYHSSVARMLYYLQPNTTALGFENADLRKAFALAFNKQSIVDNILKNGSIPADFLIVKSLASGIDGKTFRDAANQTYLETDKSKALDYYNKAKQETGKSSFTFELLYDDDDTTSQIAQFIQSEIQNTLPGVTITLKSQPKKNRIELQKSGNFQLAISRWGADYNDPSTYFDIFTTTGSYNFGKWSNSQYDQLVSSASNQLINSPQDRLNAYIKAEKIILDDAAILPIYQLGSAYLLKSNITVQQSVDGNNIWRTAKIK